jgi:site-specific DNA-methyltransferase (cytosine-N4-specific)
LAQERLSRDGQLRADPTGGVVDESGAGVERERDGIGADGVLAFEGLFAPDRPTVRVLTRNVLEVKPSDIDCEVGLVITSPPYPNAYEYWLYHKYRMYWLAMDPLSVRAAEIGARPHYFKKNHQTEADFQRQMETVFRLLSAVTSSRALTCFIVGRSIIHGRRIDNADLLERAAATVGFRRLLTVERAIVATRKTFNPAISHITSEALLIFGR